MGRSIEAGYIVPVEADAPATYCDALQTLRVSPITFGTLENRQAQASSVSDEEVAHAIRFAWSRHQLIVEPGGAVALAAVLAGRIDARDGTVIVLSGGNVDPALHARIVGEAG
jgi:threonine dehydratase